MDDNDLIKDDGVIRQCPSNIAKIGFWRTWWKFYGYKKAITDFPFREVLEGLQAVLLTLVWLILFPVIPFAQAYGDWSRAKKEVAYYDNQKETKGDSNG